MRKSIDKDLPIKLRLRRVFFLLGYYAPIEVDLSDFQMDGPRGAKRTSLTDIDVFGIRYDASFASHIAVGNCKSGRDVSDPNQVFWLRGVADYFGADVAYYVRPKIAANARTLAPRLNVRCVSEVELLAIEESLKASSLALPLADASFHDTQMDLWGANIAKGVRPSPEQLAKKSVYSYLTYSYWYIDQYRNLFSLVTRFNKVAHLMRADNPRDVLLAYVGLERFAHCLLEICRHVVSTGISSVVENARAYLYGGALGLRDRERFFDLLRHVGSTEQLDPPYLPDNLELINRMLQNPDSACVLLPYLSATYSWCVHLQKSELSPVFPAVNTGTIVLMRNLAQSFSKSAGLDVNLFASVLRL